jgi:hypothetical protein
MEFLEMDERRSIKEKPGTDEGFWTCTIPVAPCTPMTTGSLARVHGNSAPWRPDQGSAPIKNVTGALQVSF